MTDFYISLGRNGVEKQREGDQKTPIGVYTLLPMKDKLPEFYGPGAYPLTYPNEWDKVNGRSGHGIWLHGTPAETYARPPWATDGCVVLTNEDLAKLRQVRGRGAHARRDRPLGAVAQARPVGSRARGVPRPTSTAGARTGRASTPTATSRTTRATSAPLQRDYAGWSAKKRQVTAGKTWIKVGVDDVSLFEYPGERDLVMVSFEQDYRSNNLSKRTFKRQFWAREGGHWRIVHEAVVGS